MKNLWFPLCLLLGSFLVRAQPTSGEAIFAATVEHEKMQSASSVKNIPFENIGPSIMSGRVVALAVNPELPTEFYVAYASGGVWHTQDNGISFVSITDNAPTQNIGEIAMHWPSRTLWVGTGENNSSRSSYAGIGMLRTTDNGATWTQHGLNSSHHIGKILIDPNNPNHLVVGVTGHLYTPNTERGVYVTSDAGATWEQTLYINDETGIIDMVSLTADFNVVFAAAWQKDRKAWNFSGSGSHSGIYKSTDGGQTWRLMSTPESGFPTGDGVGRIGLAVYDANTIYAIHDSQFRREKEAEKESQDLTKSDFKTMSRNAFLALPNKEINTYLKQNGFHEKYRAENLKNQVRNGQISPVDLATYLEDANSLLFDTPVVGAEVYKSIDGGANWQKTHEGYLDGVYYSYGYYFGHIHVAPFDADKIYIYGVPLLTSNDGGKSFEYLSKRNVHSDHHALWINPKQPGHLINGNDGGVNITYTDGAHWSKNNTPQVGQFYAINIDHEEPYNVYGGLQDNGVWKGPHNAKEDRSWQASGQYPWKEIMGGDGMQVAIDDRNSNIVYTGYQFGNYYRLDLASDSYEAVQPKHELGEAPLRFNWQTPIGLSSHNQDILYLGSNKLHRSFNQGNDWEAISPDLTKGGKKGNVAFGTLTTFSESPFQFGMLYTGSDDGQIQGTQNGGARWELLSNKLPQNLWVSRVVASSHKKNRVYATLNGYRNDDFTPYVYVSENAGESWKAIAANLPAAPVNVIVEDPVKENILFVGTDRGVYVSFDQGVSWEAFEKGLTTVAVHDLKIQPKAKHLLVGTHGRSIYKASIAALQERDPKQTLQLFVPEKMKHSKKWGSRKASWSEWNHPNFEFQLFTAAATPYVLTIKSNDGISVYQSQGSLERGFSSLSYSLTYGKKNMRPSRKKKKIMKPAEDGNYYLQPGIYTLEIKTDQGMQKRSFTLE
ncbi:MAG: glycosyl hydrolase [Flavobacteriales bacterium]|nr:glycosyl hydrolase [Flavobacteriales bacterium]